MYYRRIFLSGMLAVILLAIHTSKSQAQFVTETVVTGIVYGTNGTPVDSGSVTVNCGTGSQSMSINPDGSYELIFQQSECKTGDTATTYASTSDGEGSNSGTVQDSDFSGPIVDIDIAIVDVNLFVPEFGIITGLLTILGASSSVAYAKLKKNV